jgi:hypothetical protein
MKTLKIYRIVILAVGFLAGTTSCDNFLEEENRESLTDATFLSDAGAFDAMVANIYNKMRTATTYYDMDELGTDIVTRGFAVTGVDELNDYVNMSPSNGAFLFTWQDHYNLIAAANVVISRADDITDLSDAQKAVGLGQAKFFRAYGYFHLVEHFGGVPLIVEEIRSANTGFTRNSEEEVYTQIIADLDDALAGVDETPAQYGRISKDAVRHLKAMVLLTRGYKSFAGTNDFEDAAALAETVLDNHPLESDFATLTDITNQRNEEVILAVLYGSNSVSQGKGNNRHQKYKFNYYSYPGMKAASSLYQKGLGPALTPFYFDLFEAGDERASATFRRVIFAEQNSGDMTILAGDTAIYFPEVAWTPTKISSVPYRVINPGTYFTNDGLTAVHYPMFKKFDNPGVPYVNELIDPLGTRDAVIFRSGETKLIAAEAYLGAGNSASAATHLTELRTRAGIPSPDVDPTDVDLDLILDERAKELAGEVSRWLDLKRTGKLIERVLAHNPHAALNNALKAKHLLRPIPQNEIDQTNGSITQNDY